MRFIRYVENNESTVRIGWIYQDWVGEIEGNMFTEYRRAEARTPLEKVRLLAPILREKLSASAGTTSIMRRSSTVRFRRFRRFS